jgi:hypothetical protein
MVFVIDKSSIPEYIVEHIKDTLKEDNIIEEDEYYDCLHTAIDDWVVGSTGEAKQLVNDFGVLNAIRLYKQEYGEFILDDNDEKVYMTLGFCIIKEWFSNYYSYEEYSK